MESNLAVGLAMYSLAASGLARDVPVERQDEVRVSQWEGRALGRIKGGVGRVEYIIGHDGWLEAEQRL